MLPALRPWAGDSATRAPQVLEFYGLTTGMTKWHYLAVEATFFLAFFLGCYACMANIRHHRR